MPTAIFGGRPDGLQICNRAELVMIYQLATVLATIKECQISSWGMSFIVSADAIFGSIRANASF